MKKVSKTLILIQCLVVMGLVIQSTVPTFSQELADDELDQQQTVGNISLSFYDSRYLAQSFKPTLDNLTRIQLRISKIGDISSDIIVILREGTINSSDIIQKSISSQSISEEKQWIEIVFKDVILDLSETYYIICQTYDGDVNNSYLWWAIDRDNYLFGWAIHSYDYENAWETNYSIDFCFQTYGKEIPKTTNLKIQYIRGNSRATIDYGIINTGESFIEEYSYFFQVTGGFVLLGRTDSGMKHVFLEPGESAHHFIFPVFGFGPITIRLEIWTDNSETDVIEKDAFLIFSYIYIRP
jgi:hypothetical protein